MDSDPDDIIAIYRQRWEIELLFQANQAELPTEILLWRKLKCHQDTNLGDIDSELTADGNAEAAGAEMELLWAGNNGQNSTDVLCGFLQLV